jgi:hypothetical protein
MIKFFLNGHKHRRALANLRLRLHVRYYSSRTVYAAARAHGHGLSMASVGFLIQLLTNRILHTRITFPKDDQ